MKDKRAFTLVELLVVISIIAVLLAILMPALRKARDQAQNIACTSNMRQIGLSLMLYAQDNNGQSIWAVYGPPCDPSMNGVLGITLLDKYLGLKPNDRVNRRRSPWFCPAGLAWTKKNQRRNYDPMPYGTTYGWNACAIPYSPWMPGWGPPSHILNLSQLKHAGECAYIGDGHWLVPPDGAWTWLIQIDPLYWAVPELLHNKGANFAFFDGHAEHRSDKNIPAGRKRGDLTTGLNAMKSSFWWPYGARPDPTF
jgi:prepilin-type N-terminal cleavage/methylation domain-containing protein/prepilin-type processing-associated H-X9-DG protein